jgi:hypothetical protein
MRPRARVRNTQCFFVLNLETDAADVLNPGYRHREAGFTEGLPLAQPEERS